MLLFFSVFCFLQFHQGIHRIGPFDNSWDNPDNLDTSCRVNDQYGEDSKPSSLRGVLKSMDIVGRKMNDSAYTGEDSLSIQRVFIMKKKTKPGQKPRGRLDFLLGPTCRNNQETCFFSSDIKEEHSRLHVGR